MSDRPAVDPHLAMLWQGDSAFPSGGFAFSNGLEGAAMLDGPLDLTLLERVLTMTMRFRWATSDRLALLHAFHAPDLDRIAAIDRCVEAATVAEPLRVGSRRNGAALLLSHRRLATQGAAELRDAISSGQALGHLPVVQGWLWRRCGLDVFGAALTSAYTVGAGLINAAVRLGGVGALEAQAVLCSNLPLMGELARQPFHPSVPLTLSSLTPWLDVAMLRHAGSELRLFSS